jgi:hypothetical protein
VAGHYYFPNWAKSLLNNIPQISGNIKIANVKQQHFIIQKKLYDSICYINRKYNNQKNIEKAENSVVKNFMKGYFSFERRIQPTTFDKSVSPFNKPRWSTSGNSYFPTKEKDKYLGIVQFSYDTLNYSEGRGMIVKYNYNENKMKIWSPTEKLMFSSTALLYKDTFNDIYYNRSIIRDSNCKELIYKYDFVNQFYSSIDKGKAWKEDKQLTQLYKTHEFRQFEFLDQNHALIFKLDKIRVKNKNYDLQRGTYYLLKNFHIIDSLKSPNDLHYNDNYNCYKYEIKNDTIFLGSWSYNKFQVGKPSFQPFLDKVDDNWKFKVTEQLYYRTKPAPQIGMITYQNFKILNNLLYLNTENESLDFKSDLSKLHENGLILENEEHIYIISLGIGTLLSFDGGNTWFVYPLPLEKDSQYDFLEIDEQGVISHLKNSWAGNGYKFNKVFSRFSKIEVE